MNGKQTFAQSPLARRLSWALCGVVAVVYWTTHYGGIRTPDAEVAFRTCEALGSRFAHDIERLKNWETFGVSLGVDGKEYSNFGIGHAVLSVPFYWLATALNQTGWHENFTLPASYYTDQYSFVEIVDREKHAVRYLMSYANILWSTGCAFLFFQIGRRFSASPIPPFLAALMFALCSYQWSYAMTALSEPMATFFILLSFRYILEDRDEGKDRSGSSNWEHALFGGFCLGLATTIHLTAILFAPFFMGMLSLQENRVSLNEKGAMQRLALFGAGLGFLLLLLLYYNDLRFGHPLETGRGVDELAALKGSYGRFAPPWRGLYGLIFSLGKSIFVYCPILLMAFVAWPKFHRAHRTLSWIILACVGFRVLFVASRTDWHSGASIGPRYLLMAVPFVLLPVVSCLDQWIREKRRAALAGAAGFSFLCASQQLYFNLGCFFHYYMILKQYFKGQGINIYFNYDLYFIPKLALFPHLHQLRTLTAPWLFKNVPLSILDLWALGSAVLLLLFAGIIFWTRKQYGRHE